MATHVTHHLSCETDRRCHAHVESLRLRRDAGDGRHASTARRTDKPVVQSVENAGSTFDIIGARAVVAHDLRRRTRLVADTKAERIETLGSS